MTEKKETLTESKLYKKFKALDEQQEKLERAIARIAHQTGTQNILKLYKIAPYEPSREDMRKWRG